MWTRRKTWPEDSDDWTVKWHGIEVGCAFLAMRTNPSRQAWIWAKQLIPGSQGEAATLDEALEAIRSTVLREHVVVADLKTGGISIVLKDYP